MTTATTVAFDPKGLQAKVKSMYRGGNVQAKVLVVFVGEEGKPPRSRRRRQRSNS